ncbi:MAG: hypothetical protein K0R24_1914 [Gammaproteobacteria bacterium]|jgi:hypothetical protein|nr:hypothetical protein [Gammaproteobacteria bacterium]
MNKETEFLFINFLLRKDASRFLSTRCKKMIVLFHEGSLEIKIGGRVINFLFFAD